MHADRPVLVVGPPRSGTTWIGEVLSSAARVTYTAEPDNEKLSPLAWLSKSELHRFPYLTPSDSGGMYQDLWQTVLSNHRIALLCNRLLGLVLRGRAGQVEAVIGEKTGFQYTSEAMHTVSRSDARRPYRIQAHRLMAGLSRAVLRASRHASRADGRRILKTVHSPLCIDWLASRFSLDVVVVLRNPYSLFASYRRMRMPDGYRNLLFQPTLQRDRSRFLPESKGTLAPHSEDHLITQIMLIYKVIASQAAGHPEWRLVSHDRLCMAAHQGYQDLFGRLALAWSDRTPAKIDALNVAGAGFDPRRLTSQQPHAWKDDLTAAEANMIDSWMDRFDLRGFFMDHVDLA